MVFRARTLGFIMRLHNRSTSYHGLIFHLEEHTLNWFWFLWYYVFSSLICRNGSMNDTVHGLRTPNEGTNQRYLKNWADVADKICCRRT